MMIKKLIFTYILLVPLSSNAGMKVTTYEKERGTNEFKIYLTGVANGFAFSNTELQAKKIQALFCPPRNEVIKVETYIKLLDERIKSFPKDKVGNLEIEPLLLDKLISTYPCK